MNTIEAFLQQSPRQGGKASCVTPAEREALDRLAA
jgi:hypothetical protein